MHLDCKSKVFCIEAESGPLYLRFFKKDDVNTNNGSVDSSDLQLLLKDKSMFYLSGFLSTNSFARNINRHEQLRNSIHTLIPNINQVYQGIGLTDEKNFERGFFILINKHGDARNLVSDLVSRCGVLGSGEVLRIYLECSDNTVHVQPFDQLENTVIDSNDFLLVPSLPVGIHPAFISSDTNSVYHTIQRCYDVLNEFESFDEIKDLKSICDKYIKKTKDWNENLPLKAKNSVIVIEGLDATGKTTLTRNLGKNLNATVLKSPPECICHLRSKFDSHPQLLRRAFYSLGNYAFAAMINEAANDGIVIVDRFWNSTAAYAIAADVGAGTKESLPPEGHFVYSWPTDLLKPDAIFLLTINDEERRKRLANRGTVKTDEEIRLEQSSPFRQRLEEAYNRMINPKMEKIDAGGTPNDVLNKTLEVLKAAELV